jgi:hypothetical protein
MKIFKEGLFKQMSVREEWWQAITQQDFIGQCGQK